MQPGPGVSHCSFSTSCRPGWLSFPHNYTEIAHMTSTHWPHQHCELLSFLAQPNNTLFSNLWITRSIRNKLLWALWYANVSLRCRHLSWIIRLHTKGPNVKMTTVVGPISRCADFVYFIGVTGPRSSCGLWMFQFRAMANFETEVYELLKIFDSSRW